MVSRNIRKWLAGLIFLSVAIKLMLAYFFELTNDEVYYWVYALFPSLSYFDHPPLVGWLIRLSTWNLTATHDFFVRLGPILLSIAGTLLVFVTGKKLKDERTGFLSAILFASSFYFSFTGFMAMPDTTLVVCWIAAIYLGVNILLASDITKGNRVTMLGFGIVAGLAMLSKYTGAFAWLALLVSLLVYQRKWFNDWSLYAALLTSAMIFMPVLIWNVNHDFISFTYQQSRVTPTTSLQPGYFFRELLGQLAYQNPLNILLIVPAVVAVFKKRLTLSRKLSFYLLVNGLPLMLIMLGCSLFRKTLPHWSGPSYLGLILVAGVYWNQRIGGIRRPLRYPFRLWSPWVLYCVVACSLLYLINFSSFSLGIKDEVAHYGKHDLANDMYGWKEIGTRFRELSQRLERTGKMDSTAHIVSYRWFPGAHIHRYIADPVDKKVFLIGSVQDLHDYYWINEQQQGLQEGQDYYHIAVSNYFRDPQQMFGPYFDRIVPLDTIPVTRQDVLLRYAFIYKLDNYRHP